MHLRLIRVKNYLSCQIFYLELRWYRGYNRPFYLDDFFVFKGGIKMIKLELIDGSIKEVEKGTLAISVAKELSPSLAKKSCVAKLNGKLVDLKTPIEEDAKFELVMFDSKGYNYPVGSTGGKNEVALTESQMPQHGAHLYHDENEWKAYADDYNSTTEGGPSTEKRYLEISALKRYDDSPWQNRGWLQEHGNEAFPSRWKRGGNQPHENRPVFYALAYIMKVI